MKVLVALCVLAFVALSYCKPQSRECIYIEGRCSSYCEENTHSYTTGCSPVTPEPTCDNLTPKENDYETCDYTACYCNDPYVRDTASGKCVPVEECPKKNDTPSDKVVKESSDNVVKD